MDSDSNSSGDTTIPDNKSDDTTSSSSSAFASQNSKSEPNMGQPLSPAKSESFTSSPEAKAVDSNTFAVRNLDNSPQISPNLTENNNPFAPTPTPTPTPTQFPLEATPDPTTPAAVGLPSTFPRKRNFFSKLSKKHWLILAAVLLVVIIGSVSAFALVYNKKENVVADSFLKLATSKTMILNGTMSGGSKDQKNALNATFNVSSTLDQSSATFDATVKQDAKSYPVKFSLVTDQKKQIFFKFEKLSELLKAYTTSSDTETQDLNKMIASLFEDFAKSIDNKWVVITQDDLKNLSGNEINNEKSECAEKQFKIFTDSKKQQQEVRKVYDNNQFIIVSKDLGTETINGTMSNHYQLKFDDKKSKSFAKGLKGTEVFKNIDKCYDGELSKSVDRQADTTASVDNESEDTPTITFDYWVNTWSHNPAKLAINISDDENSSKFETIFDLSSKPKITVPIADKTWTELQKEIETLMSKMLGTSPSVDSFPAEDDAIPPTDQSAAQARARDITRRTNVNAAKTALEVFYTDNGRYLLPSEVSLLKEQEPSLPTISVATSAAAQSPSLDEYIYQPLDQDDGLCTDERQDCAKFIIWYRLEATSEVVKATSVN